jgi:hypothetical protein
MQQFSRGEALEAIQAMSIYTIMRLTESGLDYFVANRDMLKTMQVSSYPRTAAFELLLHCEKIYFEVQEAENRAYRIWPGGSPYSVPVRSALLTYDHPNLAGRSGFLKNHVEGTKNLPLQQIFISIT